MQRHLDGVADALRVHVAHVVIAIRTVICTSDTPQDLAARVKAAIGEHASASHELHVSHATAPAHCTGGLLYSALIVLRPGRTGN